VIQEELEKDDAIILKSVLSQFKSESLQEIATSWFKSCAISQDGKAKPALKKQKVEK
jgi:hypothetical protein